MQKTSGARSIAFNTSLGLLTNVISMPFVIVAGILVSRLLGPDERGLWALLLTTNVICAQVFSFGIPLSMAPFAAKRIFHIGQIHTIALLFSIASGMVGMFIYLTIQSTLHSTVLRGVDSQQAVIAVLIFPLVLYGIMWDNIMTGMQKISALSAFSLIQVIVNFVNPVLALIVFDAGLAGLMVVWLIGSIFITTLRIFWMFRITRHSISWDTKTAQAILGFGIKIYPAFVLTILLGQTDVFFLNYFHSGREVGYYAVASAIAFRIELIGATLTSAANARLTSGTPTAVNILMSSLVRRVIAADVLIIIALVAFSSQIIVMLYGEEYRSSSLPFVVLLFAAASRSLSQLLAIHVVNHRNRPDIALVFSAISLLLAIILFTVLVPGYGALGCAYAIMLTSLVHAGLYLWTFLRSASLSIRSTIFWTREDSRWLLSLWHRAGLFKAKV